MPLTNFYCFKICILKKKKKKELLALVVLCACRGRNWFDWIQTKCLQRGWKFCHKCKSRWWETCWRGIPAETHYRSMVKHPPPSTPSPQSETTWPATYLVGQTIFQSEILWYDHHLWCLTAVLQSPTGSQRWCNLIKETYKRGVSYVRGQIWGFGTHIIHWGHYILKGLCLNPALLMSFIVQQCE